MHSLVTRALFLGTMAALATSPGLAQSDSSVTRVSAPHPSGLDLSSPQRAMDSFFVALNSFDANGPLEVREAAAELVDRVARQLRRGGGAG